MTMTDPIADMLTRIRNANLAMHEEVRMPYSKMKKALAEVLRHEGYIADYAVQGGDGPAQVLTIDLKYSPERERVITELRRISKSGRRIYTKADKLPRVMGGLGIAVLSTSKGLMTDQEARRRRLGGEVLCYVW